MFVMTGTRRSRCLTKTEDGTGSRQHDLKEHLFTLRSRKTTSAFPCCYALDLLGLVDGEMYDKCKVKVDTTQINFKELYFR